MKKADKYILLGVVVLLSFSMLGVYLSRTVFAQPGAIAVISKDGKVIESIDLSQIKEPYEFTIQSKNNGSNTIYVEKNQIKFSKANCPDHLCVKTGLLANTRDISVCLPHGLMIEIQGGSEGEIDSLSH